MNIRRAITAFATASVALGAMTMSSTSTAQAAICTGTNDCNDPVTSACWSTRTVAPISSNSIYPPTVSYTTTLYYSTSCRNLWGKTDYFYAPALNGTTFVTRSYKGSSLYSDTHGLPTSAIPPGGGLQGTYTKTANDANVTGFTIVFWNGVWNTTGSY